MHTSDCDARKRNRTEEQFRNAHQKVVADEKDSSPPAVVIVIPATNPNIVDEKQWKKIEQRRRRMNNRLKHCPDDSLYEVGWP